MTTVPVAAIAWNDRMGPSATCWRIWYRSRNPAFVMGAVAQRYVVYYRPSRVGAIRSIRERDRRVVSRSEDR
jgi:hypothetical protein